MWTDYERDENGVKGNPIPRDRFIPVMFMRGDGNFFTKNNF